MITACRWHGDGSTPHGMNIWGLGNSKEKAYIKVHLGWVYWLPYEWSTYRLSAEGLHFYFRFSASVSRCLAEVGDLGQRRQSASCFVDHTGLVGAVSNQEVTSRSNQMPQSTIKSGRLQSEMNDAAEPLTWNTRIFPGLVSSAKAAPRASAAISAAMATGEAMALAPGRAALSYMMQGSHGIPWGSMRKGNHWELRWDPRSSSFGWPHFSQSFEGARQGVLVQGHGKCRLQPDDSNCSMIQFQADLDRVAASAKLTDHMHPGICWKIQQNAEFRRSRTQFSNGKPTKAILRTPLSHPHAAALFPETQRHRQSLKSTSACLLEMILGTYL